MFVVIWSLLVLPILGQDIGHVNEMSNFRYNCSTPDLAGSILTSPCQDLCSFCSSFYVSSIDLNKCIAYDGEDSLIPKLKSVSRSPFQQSSVLSLYRVLTGTPAAATTASNARTVTRTSPNPMSSTASAQASMARRMMSRWTSVSKSPP